MAERTERGERVPVTMVSVQTMDLIFSKKVAEAFGSIQIIMGAAFIALSLSAIYWDYTRFSQVSEWFSIFWVLGGTIHILAGHSKSINLIRLTILVSVISLISTVLYEVILAYQVDRFRLSHRAIGIYSGMLAVCVIEKFFAIMAIAHCAKALCNTYTFLKFDSMDKANTVQGSQLMSGMHAQRMPLGMTASRDNSPRRTKRTDHSTTVIKY